MPRLTIKHKDRFTWAAKNQNKIKSEFRPLKIEYLTSFSSTTDTSSYTFDNLQTGGPGLLVCCIHTYANGNSRTVSSFTIDGVTAVPLINNTTNTLNPQVIMRYATQSSAGPTVSVTVNFNAAMFGVVGSLYKISNHNSSEPIYTDPNTLVSGTQTVRTLIPASQSVGIFFQTGTETTAMSVTNSSAGDLKLNYDIVSDTTGRIRAFAFSYTNATDITTGLTVSYKFAATGDPFTPTSNRTGGAAWR